MASNRKPPVRHTCPDIDNIKKTIAEIVSEMSDVEDIDEIGGWIDNLASIGIGNGCELETLRDANASLRSWGEDLANELENVESENCELQDKISDLESENTKLHDQISELESLIENIP